MKILKEGIKPFYVYRGKCTKCGCEAEYEEDEVEEYSFIFGFRSKNTCPCCRLSVIDLKRFDVARCKDDE